MKNNEIPILIDQAELDKEPLPRNPLPGKDGEMIQRVIDASGGINFLSILENCMFDYGHVLVNIHRTIGDGIRLTVPILFGTSQTAKVWDEEEEREAEPFMLALREKFSGKELNLALVRELHILKQMGPEEYKSGLKFRVCCFKCRYLETDFWNKSFLDTTKESN